IFLSMILGAAVAYSLWPESGIAGAERLAVCAFIAVAISATAMPVLIRILQECGIADSRIGKMALAGAALNDGITWLLLMLLIALVSPLESSGSVTLLSILVYIVAMVVIG